MNSAPLPYSGDSDHFLQYSTGGNGLQLMKTEFAGILQGFRRDITVYGQNFGQFPADRFAAAGCKAEYH